MNSPLDAQLVALRREVDRQREVIQRVNARCDHLGMVMRLIQGERDALRDAIHRACAAYPDDATAPTCVAILRESLRQG